jgi:hypothetical protein
LAGTYTKGPEIMENEKSYHLLLQAQSRSNAELCLVAGWLPPSPSHSPLLTDADPALTSCPSGHPPSSPPRPVPLTHLPTHGVVAQAGGQASSEAMGRLWRLASPRGGCSLGAWVALHQVGTRQWLLFSKGPQYRGTARSKVAGPPSPEKLGPQESPALVLKRRRLRLVTGKGLKASNQRALD